MSKATYELAVLLSLKDAASGRLDTFRDKLRATGKDGRVALKDFEELRKSLQRKMVVGGVTMTAGLVGLKMLKGGVTAAGEFESSLLDLKGAYQEVEGAGAMSATQQAAQLNALSHLATRFGNDLRGNTGDYVGILTSLKRAGVEATTVLGGAGEAAAHLANVSGAITRGTANEQAKELGQFGIMFDLKPQDFGRQVDLFSALKDRFDIESSDLIESAKYFQSTAKSLKLTGFEGATETSKFFALMKRRGALEGSQAGTSGTSFFQQFIAKGDQRAKIKKTTGLDVQLFDKKGEFAGFENAFKEMEKFRVYSAEKRLGLLNEMFGEQGGKVAGVMVEAGAEGWRNVTTEAQKAVPVQEKIVQQMNTYNAKMEALQGTVDNLKATTFTPMLDTLKPVADTANSLLSTLQSFSQANPGVAGVASHLLGIGSAGLVAYGGVRTLTSSWRLWRMATEFSKGDALAVYLQKVAGGAGAAGDGLAGAGTKAVGLRGKLSALSASPFKITLLLATVGFTLNELFQLKAALDEYKKSQSNLDASSRTGMKTTDRFLDVSKKQGLPVEQDFYKHGAQTQMAMLQGGDNRELEYFLQPERQDWYSRISTLGANPFNRHRGDARQHIGSADPEVRRRIDAAGGYSKFEDQVSGARHIRERGGELKIPEIMAEFRKQVAGLNLSEEAKGRLDRMLQEAFPDSFAKSTQTLQQQFQLLNTQIAPLGSSLKGAENQFGRLPFALERMWLSLSGFSSRVGGITFEPVPYPAATPTAPGGSVQPPWRLPQFPKSAVGSIVHGDGLAMLHRGNVVTPARLSRRAPGDWLESLPMRPAARAAAPAPARAASVKLEVNVHIPSGSRAAVQGGALGEFRQLPSLLQIPSLIPKSAVGSVVHSDGLVKVHRGNVITPANLSRRAPGDWLKSLPMRTAARAAAPAPARAASVKLEVNVHVPPGSRAADDPAALARHIEERLRAEIAELRGMVSDPKHLDRVLSHGLKIQRERV